MVSDKRISLIITTLNEADNITSLLDDISRQTKLPDEVVIVDAGSSDGSIDLIRKYHDPRYNLNLIVEPGANRSEGRNIAIEAASNEIIAVTDAGVRLHEDWLKNITRDLLNDSTIDVVTGMTLSSASTLIQKCYAAIIIHNEAELNHPSWWTKLYYRYIYRRRFNKNLPSSRSLAMRKAIWKQVGGYPEHILCSEDMAFNEKLRRAQAKCTLSEEAMVYWSLPDSILVNMRYFFRNSKWDAMADQFYGRSIAKIVLYGLGMILLVLGLYADQAYMIFLLLGSLVYLLHPSFIAWMSTNSPLAIVVTPLLIIGKDLSQNAGFIVGTLKKARHA